jgi:hypothetical protein
MQLDIAASLYNEQRAANASPVVLYCNPADFLNLRFIALLVEPKEIAMSEQSGARYAIRRC